MNTRSDTGSFIWYELMTTDADAAGRFYGTVVGWKFAAHSAAPPGAPDYRMIGRDDGGFVGGAMQLTADMQAHGARPTWLGYLHVADVDAAAAAIGKEGGRTLMAPFDLPVGRIAMLADPMGAPFYVMKPVPPPDRPDARSDVFDPAKAQHVRWNELASPDAPRAKAFYARHFGFEFRESMQMPGLGEYAFIDHGGLRLGAIMPRPPGGGRDGWLYYFGVRSVMASKRAIEAGGGIVQHGPVPVPGNLHIVVALDPQGAPFGIVGPLE